MTKRIIFIANHYSGSGRGKKVALQAEEFLRKKQIPSQFHPTEYPGHIRLLAPHLVKSLDPQTDRLVIIGGDGTLHEAITGLKDSGSSFPVGYLPAGTGNDFARTIGLPKKVDTYLEQILAASSPELVECLTYSDLAGIHQGVSLNSLGLGFDGTVIKVLSQDNGSQKLLVKWKMDQLIYLLGLARAFLKREAFRAEVILDGKRHSFENLFLIAAMNHPYFGGGIKLNPLVAPNNHEFGLVAITDISFPVLLRLLPKVLTNGSHIHSPHFTHLPCRELEIHLLDSQYGQVDGELIEKGRHQIRFGIDTFLLWQ